MEEKQKDTIKRIIYGTLMVLSTVAEIFLMIHMHRVNCLLPHLRSSDNIVRSSVEEFESYYENGDIKKVYYTREGRLYEIYYTFTETDAVGNFEIVAYNSENLNEKNTFLDEYSMVEIDLSGSVVSDTFLAIFLLFASLGFMTLMITV